MRLKFCKAPNHVGEARYQAVVTSEFHGERQCETRILAEIGKFEADNSWVMTASYHPSLAGMAPQSSLGEAKRHIETQLLRLLTGKRGWP